jgi:hypothetical protein
MPSKNPDPFVWQPQQCKLLEWEAADFCSNLGQRTILMIGDSTMAQMASTFWAMLAFGEWAPSEASADSVLDPYDAYIA